jgi:hypothetical protein
LADDLDSLLAAITADTKPSPAVAACDDAKSAVSPILNVAITGGVFKPSTTTPATTSTQTPTTTTTATTTPTLSIVIDPQSITKNLGDSHTFTVVATTSDNSGINYQWQKFDTQTGVYVDIGGASSDSYTLNNISASDETDYICKVSSATGQTSPVELLSQSATLQVAQALPAGPPTAYGYAGATLINFNSSAFVSTNLNGLNNFVYNGPPPSSIGPSLTVGGKAVSSFVAANFTPFGSSGVSYSLLASPQKVLPGGTVTLLLKTFGVPNGTVLDFYIFGPNLQVSDVVNGTLSGKFIVSNNTAKKLITVSDPVSFSTTELVFAALKNGGAATQFAIVGNGVPVFTPPTPPPPQPPIACTPVVSSTGKIIDIAICKQGNPYIQAPKIYVQGNGVGYGASAVADLDKDGYLKRIRVVRPGRGYPPNPPTNLDCIISGFTIIKPGFGYDQPPAVFVDGDLDVAEAVVQNGVLVGIEVKDKSRTFTEYPSIKIIPTSQGVGAVAIANVACLDKQDVREIAEVVGPTPVGEYIDCP